MGAICCVKKRSFWGVTLLHTLIVGIVLRRSRMVVRSFSLQGKQEKK